MPMHRQPLMRDRKPIKGLKLGDKISVTVLRKHKLFRNDHPLLQQYKKWEVDIMERVEKFKLGNAHLKRPKPSFVTLVRVRFKPTNVPKNSRIGIRTFWIE